MIEADALTGNPSVNYLVEDRLALILYKLRNGPFLMKIGYESKFIEHLIWRNSNYSRHELNFVLIVQTA